MTDYDVDDAFAIGLVIALITMAVVTALTLGGAGTMRAPSDYTGYVVDVEHNKGLIFRTTQVKMKTHPRSSESEEFCVRYPKDKDVLETSREALQEGERVRVEYKRPFIVPPTQCNGGLSFIYDIEYYNNSS